MDTVRLTLNDGYPTEAGFKSGIVHTYRNERDGYVSIWYDGEKYIIAGNRDGKEFTHTRTSYQTARERFRKHRNVVASYGITHPQVRRYPAHPHILRTRAYDYAGEFMAEARVRFMPIQRVWKVEKMHPYSTVAARGTFRVPKVTDIRCETLFDAMCIALGGRIE